MVKRRQPVKLDISAMNHTEMIQLLMSIGVPNISYAVPRRVAAHLLRLWEDANTEAMLAECDAIGPAPMDKFREKIRSWLIRYWDKMQLQVPQPQCPDCFKSCDAQVVQCWLDNHRQIT